MASSPAGAVTPVDRWSAARLEAMFASDSPLPPTNAATTPVDQWSAARLNAAFASDSPLPPTPRPDLTCCTEQQLDDEAAVLMGMAEADIGADDGDELEDGAEDEDGEQDVLLEHEDDISEGQGICARLDTLAATLGLAVVRSSPVTPPQLQEMTELMSNNMRAFADWDQSVSVEGLQAVSVEFTHLIDSSGTVAGFVAWNIEGGSPAARAFVLEIQLAPTTIP